MIASIATSKGEPQQAQFLKELRNLNHEEHERHEEKKGRHILAMRLTNFQDDCCYSWGMVL